jgi:hypothetical protein
MKTKDLPNGSCIKDVRFDFNFFKDYYHWYSPNGKTFAFDEMDKKLEGPNYHVVYTPSPPTRKEFFKINIGDWRKRY